MRLVVALLLALAGAVQDESVSVSPDIGVAGHFDTWTVTYYVGAGDVGAPYGCSCQARGMPANATRRTACRRPTRAAIIS